MSFQGLAKIKLLYTKNTPDWGCFLFLNLADVKPMIRIKGSGEFF